MPDNHLSFVAREQRLTLFDTFTGDGRTQRSPRGARPRVMGRKPANVDDERSLLVDFMDRTEDGTTCVLRFTAAKYQRRPVLCFRRKVADQALFIDL